jgi:hypothetical protein
MKSASYSRTYLITLVAKGLLRGPASSPEMKQFCNMLVRLREAVGRKKLGRFCLGVIILDNVTSHIAQVNCGLSSMDGKCCSIYHTVQTWYLQFFVHLKKLCCGSNQLVPCT